MTNPSTPQITVDVHLAPGGPLSGMAADVRAGLTKPFKELSPRYFYDERGSELFEQITELPEYYPTRCEREILERDSAEIVSTAGDPATLIELGSGSAAKTRVLLDAMRDAGCLDAYAPVDISEEITRETAGAIASEYAITVHGLVCDFERDLERMPLGGPRVIALLGGTIGNFEPAQRASFLARVANLLGDDDHFLLGTDLVKDRATLEAAYNDSAGVTAEFNKNVLAVLNDRLGMQLRPRRLRARRLLGRGEPLGRHPAAVPGEAGGRRRGARHAGRFRPRRGDAHRDLDQVRAPGARGHLPRVRPRDGRLVDGPGRAVRALSSRPRLTGPGGWPPAFIAA